MAYKCECLFVCVRNPPSAASPHWYRSLLNVLLWPDYSQSAFKYLSPRSISPFFGIKKTSSPSYSTPCSSQSQCVDKIYNISVKTVMRFELFVRWNSKARIPIDGEASRFCVCVFIVMLSFCISKAIVFTTGGEVIFSWWFSPENQDRESSYTFSMQWYECLQTGSEGMNLLFERRDINLGLLQCALPPKAGWQMPNPKLDAQLKLEQSKKIHFKCIL